MTPEFLLITAVDATDPASNGISADTTKYLGIGESDQLDETWCGVDNADSGLVGAIVLSDGTSDGGKFEPNLDGLPDYLTTGLKLRLTNLVSNNLLDSDDLFDFSGLDSAVFGPQDSYVVATTDGSYVVPMRNRIKLADTAGKTRRGGFNVRFCAISSINLHMEDADESGERRHMSRRMMATSFTTGSSGNVLRSSDETPASSVADKDKLPLPNTVDMRDVLFEAQPETVTITIKEDKGSSGLDGADITIIVVASVFFLFVIILGIVIYRNAMRSESHTGYRKLPRSVSPGMRRAASGYPVMNTMYGAGDIRQRAAVSLD